MNTKTLMVALLASVTLAVPAHAGNGRHNGGGNVSTAKSSGARVGGGSAPSVRSMSVGRFNGGTFRSMPVRSFSNNRTLYSGQRFQYGGGVRSTRPTGFSSPVVKPNVGGGFASTQFNRPNNQRLATGVNQFRNGQTRTGGGNAFPSNWKNHVFAQHSANWQRSWARNRDHWWHGHRCHFFNGSWVIFDIGFSPWWWGYPYDYYYGYPYGYGYYPYGYNYDYGYGYNDPGVYDSEPAYDQSYNGGYDQSNTARPDQSANSSVAAAQDKLAREGFYRGQIDGVLGPETRHAIVRFQSSRGLRINGDLTTETLDALGLREYASGYSSY